MVAHSVSSKGSSRVSSNSSVYKLAGGTPSQHDGDAVFDQRSSLENGVFGVLFTLSKENSESRIRIRWVLLKMALDAWQLFTTIVKPQQGWHINPDGSVWTIVSVLTFNWLKDLGYGAYLAVLYSMLALLAVNVAMCVWVAWCFKEQKFPVVWPITVLRVFSGVFFQAFDVTSLNLLQLGFSCNYTGPVRPRLHFYLFPEYSCTSLPHAAHALVSALCLLLFVAIALLLNLAEVEVNPLSRRPLALGHSGSEVMVFAIKVVLTLVDVFIGWRRVAACMYLALSLAFAYQTVRWCPNLVAWVNYVKSGVAVATLWCSAMLVVLVFRPVGHRDEDELYAHDSWSVVLTGVMLGGLLPAGAVGAWLTRIFLRRMTTATLKVLENPGARPDDICDNLDDPRDVEIVVRCCRVWKDKHTLASTNIEKAHNVIKAGLACFPTSPFMVLLHANFMIEVMGVSQSGARRIQDAKKLKPAMMCRFMMFVRQQQASQLAASSTANGGASMDLLGYVEYQRKQRMVVRLHREALQAMCNFWKALDSSSVSFTQLSKSLGKIDSSVSQAQAAYRVTLEAYGNNPALVRLYGKFLLTIKNDPWTAANFFAEAERLEELKQGDSNGPLLPDGTPLGRMDEMSTAVVVVNTAGEMQMANRQAHHLFGYKRGALDGKPMSALLAPHCAQWLSKKLLALVSVQALVPESGGADQDLDGAESDPERDINTERHETVLVGMHCDRVAFPLRVSLCKVSGVGEDSTIVAMLDPVSPIRNTASLWVTKHGAVVACDPQFAAMFGWAAGEVAGTNLAALLSLSTRQEGEQGAERAMVRSQSARAADYQRGPNDGGHIVMRLRLLRKANASEDMSTREQTGLPCMVAHKYDSNPVPCIVRLSTKVEQRSSVYEVRLRLAAAEPPLLLVVSGKGGIVHASPDLIACLRDAHSGSGYRQRLGMGAAGGPELEGADGDGADGDGTRNPIHMTLEAAQAITHYTFFDFLPHPWKDMHVRFLRDTTSLSTTSHGVLSCRNAAPPGPTLELRTVSGKPVYMAVSVGTGDVAGDRMHVVHIARSSLEKGLAERRLRLRVSAEGLIAAVQDGSPKQLFGLETQQITGRGLWEVVTGLPAGHTGGGFSGRHGPRMYEALTTCARDSPGSSWRVQVAPPLPRGDRSQSAARAIAERQAFLQISLPAPSYDADANEPTGLDPELLVDLWPLPSVCGLLDLDSGGLITGVLEEALRPAGLLFGLPSASLVGMKLADLVAFPPGRTRPTDLLTLHADKKSSLKTNKKSANSKVGPPHVLQGVHPDGRPLLLDVQVVAKPGSDQPSVAIVRPHTAPMMPKVGLQLGQPPRTAATIATRTASGWTADMQATDLPATNTAATVASTLRNDAGMPGTPDGPAATVPVKAASSFKSAHLSMQPSADAASSQTAVAEAGAPGAVGVALPPRPGSRSRPLSTGAQGPAPLPPMPSRAPTPPKHLEELVRLPLSDAPDVGIPSRSGSASHLRPSGPSYTSDRPAGARVRRPSSLAPPQQVSEEELLQASLVGREPAETADGRAPVQPSDGVLPGAVMLATVEDVDDTAEAKGVDSDEPAKGMVGSDGSDTGGLGGAKLGPAKSQPSMASARVQDWVASKGAFYQNSVAPTVVQSDEERSLLDEPLGGGDSGGPLRRATSPLPAAERARAGKAFGPIVDTDTKLPAGAAVLGGEADHPQPPANDIDDAASEADGIAISGLAGSNSAEYKRGKRFRKLVKMMDSSNAKQVQQRFFIHAMLVGSLVAAVHILCFVLTVRAIKSQQYSMTLLAQIGETQRHMHEIMTNVRALDVINRNLTLPHLYTVDDTEKFVADIAYGADLIKVRFNDINSAHPSESSPIRQLFYNAKYPVWKANGPNGTDIFTNVTIWDYVTRFYTTSKDVQQYYDEWQAQGVHISDTDAGQFLLKSGPDLWRYSRSLFDALLYDAVDSAHQVDTLQLVFLAVEGTFVSCLAAFYVAYLLRAVAAQRYKLFGIFLAIPVGLTRALASQNTALLVGDEEEEEAEEDEAGKQEEHAEGDDVEDGMKTKRRASLCLAPDGRVGSITAIAVAGVSAPIGKELATEDVSGRPHGGSKRWRQVPSGVGYHADTTGFWGRMRWRLRRVVGRWHRPGGSTKTASRSGSEKRQLRNNSRDTVIIISPFVVWSIMVIIIYSVAVMEMSDISRVVAIHSVTNFVAARAARSVFYAQEVAIVGTVFNASLLASKRSGLVITYGKLVDSWYTLLLGSKAYIVGGNATEVFPLVTGGGISYSSPELQRLIYAAGYCLRLEGNLPCPGPDYRFYEISHTGVDSMMQRFILSLDTLGTNTSKVPEGLSDEHFDYIYNVGAKDLVDGTVRIGQAHYDIIIKIFDDILIFHIILFLLMWVLFAAFLFLLLRPLVVRISKERRQIAELMSQLPLELNVEKLVARALGGGAAGGANTEAGGGGAAADHATSGDLDAGAEDHAVPETMWKAIVRSASSLTGKLQGGGSAHGAPHVGSVTSATGNPRRRRSSLVVPQ